MDGLVSNFANLQATVTAKPHYRSVICRHVRVWHDVGVLSYCSSSSATPVAQFIAAKPLSPDCNSFALEIINEGRECCISIGLCPSDYRANGHPGWKPNSVGYHADDGGIFVESGHADTNEETCHKGDIMVCEADFRKHKLYFYKNYELMATVRATTPVESWHPAVGMHSPGESVRLLQKEPWQ
eukprot:GHVL01033169.1.p1 GENE.GHVL01033169.1~~GHVL01033169.1.p1  ORF type:complete len:184 (+),score=2.87 GHVL01033169.1:158-709(+)